MQVLGLRWHYGEALVEPLHERGQEGVAAVHVADLCLLTLDSATYDSAQDRFTILNDAFGDHPALERAGAT